MKFQCKYHFVLLMLFVFAQFASAQFYTTGNTPWFTKYHTIQSPDFQLIFPAQMDSTALRFASILDTIKNASIGSYSVKPAKIPIILNNQSVISNGYVTWGPKRMEIVSTSSQDINAIPWTEELALHEYRHVVQLSKLNSGFTHYLSYLVGQIAIAPAAAILPLWFYEGDAVYNESVLSSSGRGRSANFLTDVNALEKAGIRYSYDKAYLGSYKNYVPNHYQYGYFMVKHVNYYYGEKKWDKVLKNIANRPFLIIPFNSAVKNTTGLSKVELYQQSMDSLHNELANREKAIPSKNEAPFITYRGLVVHPNGDLYALKSSLDDISRIVKRNDTLETVFHTPGYMASSRLAINRDYLAWEEIKQDARWEKRNYNVVKLKNIRTGKISSLSKKSRHYSPAFSPDEEHVLVIHQSLNHRYSLQVYTLKPHTQEKEFFPPLDLHLSSPAYINDTSVVVIGTNHTGKSLWKVNIQSNQWEQLSESVFYSFSNLSYSQGKLYYQSDYDGKNNIYSLELKTGAIHRLTNDENGASYPVISANKDTLYYASYSIHGAKVQSQKLTSTLPNTSIDSIAPHRYKKLEALAETKNFNLSKSNYPLKKYEIKKYPKLAHTFNTHSWLPFYTDVDAIVAGNFEELPLYLGFTLFTQNSLETIYGQVSYYFNKGYHHLQPKLTLTGWYPIFRISYDVMGEDLSDFQNQFTQSPVSHRGNYNFTLESYVPLAYNINSWYVGLQPAVSFVRSSYAFNPKYDKDSLPNTYKYLYTRFYGSLIQKTSIKDINPKWGIALSTSYGFPIKDIIRERRFYALTSLYLPGLFPHHSLHIQGGYQLYEWPYNFPRGVIPKNYEYIEDYYISKVNYLFPFAYPEWSIGPLAYIKRFSATAFYDHAFYTLYHRKQQANSLGIAIRSDMHFLQFYAPCALRFQLAYDINREKITPDFGMSFSF